MKYEMVRRSHYAIPINRAKWQVRDSVIIWFSKGVDNLMIVTIYTIPP